MLSITAQARPEEDHVTFWACKGATPAAILWTLKSTMTRLGNYIGSSGCRDQDNFILDAG